ncbi:MAG: cytochrome c-type biogenesis protein CcmH [Gemmatimonadota bacterium]|nr:MAG: cytochrome c-type biogenesis protein CcmH [Gemmatimonadota bacterium]
MQDSVIVTRRAAVGAAFAALLPISIRAGQGQDTTQSAAPERLPYPGMVGAAKERITDYENDPFIIGIEERLRCTCGCNLDVYTCRTTDFTCGTSPEMHRQVVRLIESGSTEQEVIDAFVAQHGELVLMAPKKEGFNIVGYVLPGIAITAVGALMLWVLSRKNSVTAAEAQAAGSASIADTEMSADDAARLEAELADLE